jgi:hypothetical protein
LRSGLRMSQIWCLLWLTFWCHWDAGPFDPLVFVVFVQCRTRRILCKLLCILHTFSYTLMMALSQKRSTSMTIETDLVFRMVLRNHHLVRRAFMMSPHLQVRLMSARRSSYVYDNNSVS